MTEEEAERAEARQDYEDEVNPWQVGRCCDCGTRNKVQRTRFGWFCQDCYMGEEYE